MKTRGKIKDKKQAILDAALSLITEFGFHGTSIKMISNLAGVAAGTIYIHFKNKEEMIDSLYTKVCEEIDEVLYEQCIQELSFKDTFINTWIQLVEYYINDLRIPDFVSQYAYSPYITTDSKNDNNHILTVIINLFSKAQEQGVIKQMPMPALIALVHGPITSMLRMTKYEEINTEDIDIQNFALSCWAAIEAKN